MEKVKKQREIRFEVLRIIAMILIIFHHYAWYGGLTEVPLAGINMWVGRFLYMGGQVGVNIFMLITGFFMINSKFKSKKAFQLILETVFYSFLVECFFIWKYSADKQEIKFLSDYWFVNCYLAIYIISPFLNKFIKSLERKQLKVCLILLFIVFQFFVQNTHVAWLTFVYMLGAYIKLYNGFEFKKHNGIKWCILSILGYAAILGSMIIIPLTYKYGYRFDNIEYGQANTVYNLAIRTDYKKFTDTQSFLVLFDAMAFFLWFKAMKIESKNEKPNIIVRFINFIVGFIGRCTFAVYLLHETETNRYLVWWKIFGADKIYFEPMLAIFMHAFYCAGILFAIAIVGETIRINLLEKPLFKFSCLDNICEKIDTYVNIV